MTQSGQFISKARAVMAEWPDFTRLISKQQEYVLYKVERLYNAWENGLILREVQVLELNDVWGVEFDQLAFNGFMATIAQDYKG